MTEISMAWSDLHPGLRVAFLTPRFLKHGTIVMTKGRALKVRFDGEKRDTALPDARWYFVQHRSGDAENGLWVIEDDAPPPTQQPTLDDGDAWRPVAQAVEDFGVDAKTLRRWLRAGKVQGRQEQGIWKVDCASLGRHLAER